MFVLYGPVADSTVVLDPTFHVEIPTGWKYYEDYVFEYLRKHSTENWVYNPSGNDSVIAGTYP